MRSGIGDPYFPQDGNGGIDVLHYDVRDSYAFGSGRLAGRTRLDVRATQDLSRFNLDFLLPVRSVTRRRPSAPVPHRRRPRAPDHARRRAIADGARSSASRCGTPACPASREFARREQLAGRRATRSSP